MNVGQIRILLGIAACVALYQSAGAANKYLVSDAEVRKTYANSMNLDPDTQEPRETETGAAFFAAGVGNRDFVAVLEYPSQTQCDAYLDFIAQDQTFLADLDAHGFRNVGCVRYDGGKSTWQTRRIVPPTPAPPSTEPHTVPQRHAAKVVEARA